MNRQVGSRTQRRMEKRQSLLLLILALVVALVSFALGVMVGRGGRGEAPVAAVTTAEPQRIASPAPPEPVTEESGDGITETVVTDDSSASQLTFYDSLPQGKQPPLGSGINLPPGSGSEPSKASASATSTPRPAAASAPTAATATAPRQVTASVPAPKAVTPKPAPAVAPTPAPPAEKKTAPAKSDSGALYVVQVASLKEKSAADGLRDRLAQKGFPAYVEGVNLGNKGYWYRIYAGPFTSREAANSSAAAIKADRLATSTIVRAR